MPGRIPLSHIAVFLQITLLLGCSIATRGPAKPDVPGKCTTSEVLPALDLVAGLTATTTLSIAGAVGALGILDVVVLAGAGIAYWTVGTAGADKVRRCRKAHEAAAIAKAVSEISRQLDDRHHLRSGGDVQRIIDHLVDARLLVVQSGGDKSSAGPIDDDDGDGSERRRDQEPGSRSPAPDSKPIKTGRRDE